MGLPLVGIAVAVGKTVLGSVLNRGKFDLTALGQALAGNASATAQAAEYRAEGDVAIAHTEAQKDSYKDEIILILVSAPYFAFIIVLYWGIIGAIIMGPPKGKTRFDIMMENSESAVSLLATFPTWWTIGLFIPIALAVMGVVQKRVDRIRIQNGNGKSE